MKILHAILIIYIIGLQALPCADNSGECDAELLVNENHHDSHPGSEKDCSPFCACHCCRTQMISLDFITTSPVAHTNRIQLISLPFEFAMQESQNSIWQPPKEC